MAHTSRPGCKIFGPRPTGTCRARWRDGPRESFPMPPILRGRSMWRDSRSRALLQQTTELPPSDYNTLLESTTRLRSPNSCLHVALAEAMSFARELCHRHAVSTISSKLECRG